VGPKRVPVPTMTGVVIGQVLDLPDGSKLVELVIRRFCNIWRYQFWDALDIDGGTRFARTFGDGIRHGFGTAIGGIIENENFCHDGFLMFVG
jgi:hypothetical protein